MAKKLRSIERIRAPSKLTHRLGEAVTFTDRSEFASLPSRTEGQEEPLNQ